MKSFKGFVGYDVMNKPFWNLGLVLRVCVFVCVCFGEEKRENKRCNYGRWFIYKVRVFWSFCKVDKVYSVIWLWKVSYWVFCYDPDFYMRYATLTQVLHKKIHKIMWHASWPLNALTWPTKSIYNGSNGQKLFPILKSLLVMLLALH